jgi:hypothetical protein
VEEKNNRMHAQTTWIHINETTARKKRIHIHVKVKLFIIIVVEKGRKENIAKVKREIDGRRRIRSSIEEVVVQ